MKALKATVILMTVFLIVGFGVVVYTIATRVSEGGLTGGGEPEVVDSTVREDRTVAFGDREVSIPAGCRLAHSEFAGDKVLLRFEGNRSRGCQRVEIYSAKSGNRLGGWIVEDDRQTAN